MEAQGLRCRGLGKSVQGRVAFRGQSAAHDQTTERKHSIAWFGVSLCERLRIAEERFEAVVHVLLNVAMEERETRLIGGEVDHGAAVVGHNHGVFDEA